MNFCGNFIDISKENDVLLFHHNIKLWYILYSKPMNNKEYYSALSMANIYINEKFLGMNYNISYKNSIIDNIEINKH